MNGAALKAVWVENGAEGAREKLKAYWKAVSHFSPRSHFDENFNDFAAPFADMWKDNLKNLGLAPTLDTLESYWSPYAFNPMDVNYLRDIVVKNFDEAALQSRKGPKLFVNATNVRTGRIKVFKGKALNVEALLASAALPSVFKAVEIDGEAYWDGGYTGNPALFPLIDHTDCDDLLIVHINPLMREKLPKSPVGIENRVNEISFNTPLLRELRQIGFVERWMKRNAVDGEFKSIRLHSIADDEFMTTLSAESKIFASQKLIDDLYTHGRDAAEKFLKKDAKKIGKSSSLNWNAYLE